MWTATSIGPIGRNPHILWCQVPTISLLRLPDLPEELEEEERLAENANGGELAKAAPQEECLQKTAVDAAEH